MRSLVRLNFVAGMEKERAAILPAEQAHVGELMAQGVIEAGYLAADRSGAWMVVQGESPDHIQQVLRGLPFYPFIEPEVTPLRDVAPQSRTPSRADNTDWPLPREGVAVTHLLIVRDIARSRRFYADILGAYVLMEGPPAILRFYNTWLVLSTEGGPTDDKPDVVAVAPPDSRTLTSALNLRVADIRDLYDRWQARGAEFLTPPKEHASEIRCYLRDPDGHLIEVGQTTTTPAER